MASGKGQRVGGPHRMEPSCPPPVARVRPVVFLPALRLVTDSRYLTTLARA
jgi:hypothetical protein